MKKFAVMAVALLTLAGSFSACGGSSDSNNVAAIVGSLLIQLNGGNGGNSAGSVGGVGGTIVLQSQAEVMILSSGAAAIPAVTYGASPTVISTSMDWTDDGMGLDGQPGVTGVDDDGVGGVDDCGEMGYGDDTVWYPDGFAVAAGVVITLDDANSLPCGMVVFAEGPIVLAGAIVNASTNTSSIDVWLESNPMSATDDQTIIIGGLIDLRGPDSTTGIGVDGGSLTIANDYWNGDFPVILAGNINTSGGDTTFTNASGGFGGAIVVRGGEDADIVVQGNLLLNGGDGAGTGAGGFAGALILDNYWGGIDTTVLGRIVLYNINSISVNGGSGEDIGAPAGVLSVTSAFSSVLLQPAIVGEGGDAGNDVDATGGPGMITLITTNPNSMDSENLITDANVLIESNIDGRGGDCAGDGTGGPGGVLVTSMSEGNLGVSGVVWLSGGSALGTGGVGGTGGTVSLVDSFVTDADPRIVAAKLIIANGGNGEDIGGNGGTVTIVNSNTPNADSAIIVLPNSFSVVAGQGGTTDGNIGNVMLAGNVKY